MNLFYIDDSSSSSSSDSSIGRAAIAEEYDTDSLRHNLRKFGHPPGPIIPTTKQLYVQKLKRILKDQAPDQANTEQNNIVINISPGIFLNCIEYSLLYKGSKLVSLKKEK